MKPLEDVSIEQAPAEVCARTMLEVVPLVMHTIRAEMRGHRAAELSVPQFRTLGFVRRRAGASLSDAATHIGLTLPSTSKLVDALVARGLVKRTQAPEDRRRVSLVLTARGQALLATARAAAAAHLVEALAPLGDAQLADVTRSLELLRPLFAPGGSRQA